MSPFFWDIVGFMDGGLAAREAGVISGEGVQRKGTPSWHACLQLVTSISLWQ